MSRQANGTYVAPANTAAVSGGVISSTAYNTLQSDVGNELTNSLDRQGRGAMLADLDAGGNRVKNVATPAISTDAATKGYIDTGFVANSANSVANSNLAQAPQSTLKGTYNAAAGSTATITVTIATPAVVTWTAHGLAAGTPVVFSTAGALPTGITANAVYYVISAGLGVNTFQVSATVGGSAVNTSGTQSGTHTGKSFAMASEQDLPLDYVGPLLSSYAPQTPGAAGLKVTNNATTPDTKIDVTADSVFLTTLTGRNVRHNSVSLTINGTTTGANGIDTGSLAASTWYYVYLISDGTTIAGLLSASATSPTLPTGYPFFTRFGAVRTDGAIKLYRTIQRGNLTTYKVTAGTNTPNLPIMASGPAGNVTTPTWVAVSTSSYVPPTAPSIRIVAMQSAGTVMVAPNADYGSYTSATNLAPLSLSSVYTAARITADILRETTDLYWAASADGRMACYGWIDGVAAV